MKQFIRAVRDGLRYWKTLVLAFICSLGVAVLWGGSIGALFPLIEVTMRGESLQEWNRDAIEQSETRMGGFQNNIEQLQQQTELPQADQSDLQLQIEKLQSKIKVEQDSLDRANSLKPWINQYMPDDPFQTVALIVVILMGSTVVKHIFLLGNTMLVARVSTSIARDVRKKIFEKALVMDRKGFSGYGISGFTAHIAHTTDMLAGGVTALYGGAVREPLKVIACLIGASLISWRLLLVTMLLVPLILVMIAWLGKRLKHVCKNMVSKSLGFHHVMHEVFGSMQTVQAYNMEPKERDRFADSTEDLKKFSLKLTFYNALTRPITELFGIGMVSVALVAGAYLVIHRETHLLGIQLTNQPLTISAMMTFFGLLIGASDPLRKLSAVFSGINTGMVAAEMLYPVLDREPLIKTPAEPKPISQPFRKIELRNVDFSYLPEEPVLQQVDLEIDHGETYVILGPNGCGKSTLINLLCRFYDPQKGSVLIDGVDLRQISLDGLRRRIGMVSQQTQLFNESIFYNIQYGSLQATKEEVYEAARRAHAYDFITKQLPEKFDTKVGENGLRLSGGQRQRISLARAILRDPEILILDEATCQIDMQSEHLIHQALKEFGKNRTVLIITHRRTAMELADAVIEFKDGKLIKKPIDRSQAA